jgi:hypothetical protein
MEAALPAIIIYAYRRFLWAQRKRQKETLAKSAEGMASPEMVIKEV